MRNYEIVCTFLNGCAGAAWPQTTFTEAVLDTPESYLREKHGREFARFQKELFPDRRAVYTFGNGAVTYIYEFTPL